MDHRLLLPITRLIGLLFDEGLITEMEALKLSLGAQQLISWGYSTKIAVDVLFNWSSKRIKAVIATFEADKHPEAVTARATRNDVMAVLSRHLTEDELALANAFYAKHNDHDELTVYDALEGIPNRHPNAMEEAVRLFFPRSVKGVTA